LRLEGRRDEEARKIMNAQPKWGQEVELLNYASKVLNEFKASGKAQATAQLARQIQARNKKDDEENKEHARKANTEKRQLTEREVAQQQVETALFCAKVLAKASRGDAAHSLEQWANALKLRLAGVRNEKALAVYRRAPSREATGKHLAMAAEILQDQGDREHAQFVAEMARSFAGRRSRREHEEEEEIEEEIVPEEVVEEHEISQTEEVGEVELEGWKAEVATRVLKLQRKLEGLEADIEQLQKALEQIRRRRDK